MSDTACKLCDCEAYVADTDEPPGMPVCRRTAKEDGTGGYICFHREVEHGTRKAIPYQRIGAFVYAGEENEKGTENEFGVAFDGTDITFSARDVKDETGVTEEAMIMPTGSDEIGKLIDFLLAVHRVIEPLPFGSVRSVFCGYCQRPVNTKFERWSHWFLCWNSGPPSLSLNGPT